MGLLETGTNNEIYMSSRNIFDHSIQLVIFMNIYNYVTI